LQARAVAESRDGFSSCNTRHMVYNQPSIYICSNDSRIGFVVHVSSLLGFQYSVGQLSRLLASSEGASCYMRVQSARQQPQTQPCATTN
jgi:hypothetical protein